MRTFLGLDIGINSIFNINWGVSSNYISEIDEYTDDIKRLMELDAQMELCCNTIELYSPDFPYKHTFMGYVLREMSFQNAYLTATWKQIWRVGSTSTNPGTKCKGPM